MKATVEQLATLEIFSPLQDSELQQLQPHTEVRAYQSGEILMQEGDRLPDQLYALVEGTIRITKTASTGKETILRTLTAGEMFAAPALFGDRVAPAMVTAETPCQVLTVKRAALLEAIRTSPEIALSMLSVFNQRLQQLHNTVHGLVSERAIVRLARYLQYFAAVEGTDAVAEGEKLRSRLSYYQIARSIGITYEECVRLFKQLHDEVSYRRGGEIVILDAEALEAIASGVS